MNEAGNFIDIRFARSDRPDRLIGDDDICSVNALQPGFNLCLQYFLPAFLFFASFADAVEYFQTAADGTADLVIQCFIDDSGCLFIGYTGIAQVTHSFPVRWSDSTSEKTRLSASTA